MRWPDEMPYELIELSPLDGDPVIACDRGVALTSSTERTLHQPDVSLLLLERGSLVARCSCWWKGSGAVHGAELGIIGHYAAADADCGVALLQLACEKLASCGSATVVGPMDGNTWRRYRFIVERGTEPVFFLEPDNPDDWPEHWRRAGFAPVATYTSAANDDLTREDQRSGDARARLGAAGISVRAFDPSRVDAELRAIFELSLLAFRDNFLYSPISEREFLGQYNAVLPYVRPELVLLAERNDTLVGVMVALPDILQLRRGGVVDTVILKTIAVDPSATGLGLGGVMMDLVQRAARELGFRRAIHALIHDRNVSRRISDRYAHTMRRYALLSRSMR